jgi:hypothetical protein
MSRKELIRYFNPDIPDEQLDEMLGELKAEQIADTPEMPETGLLQALRQPVG